MVDSVSHGVILKYYGMAFQYVPCRYVRNEKPSACALGMFGVFRFHTPHTDVCHVRYPRSIGDVLVQVLPNLDHLDIWNHAWVDQEMSFFYVFVA